MESRKKPSIEEVIRYATPQVRKFIGEIASDLPIEQREEIEQDAYLRLVSAYDAIDAELGWKSFVYLHCRGAVLDYCKFGRGFHEKRWSIASEEGPGSSNPGKMRSRLDLVADGEDVDIDHVLGMNGAAVEAAVDVVKIRWELVERMASQDECLRAFASHIRGNGIEELAPTFGLCRARVGQLIQAFAARFDDPELADCPWFKQTCYAFGLCKHMGMPDVDQSEVLGFQVGWGLPRVDLDDLTPCQTIQHETAQLDLFGGSED